MIAIAWLVVLELTVAYGLSSLRSPADAALLAALLLLGTGAGYYGLMGRYWQALAWFAALAWYSSSMARYLDGIEPVLSAAPEALQLLILIWVPMLPVAWMLSIMATQFGYWQERWTNDD